MTFARNHQSRAHTPATKGAAVRRLYTLPDAAYGMSCCGSSVLVISSAVSLLRLLVSLCRWFYTVMTKVDRFDRVDHG